jgi:hypothetical protein
MKKHVIGAVLVVVVVLVGIPCYRYVFSRCCGPAPIDPGQVNR